MLFQPSYSSAGWQVVGAHPSSSGCKTRTHHRQGTLPLQDAHTHTHFLRLGQFRYANLPHMHILGMWEETHADMERTCKLHTDWALLEIDFLPSSIL